MPQAMMHSVEEVLNFTVKDIQGQNFVDVKIKGWANLTSERRERCILKLRDLVRQRDEMARSDAVDANELEERLRRVRSYSSTPLGPDDNDPEVIEADLSREKEAYQALLDDHGRPCYPIERGFEVLDDPGHYKDIISYWKGEPGFSGMTGVYRMLNVAQLARWKNFRLFQQKNRRYYVPHDRFPEYQRKVSERRQRLGLDGAAQLLEDPAQQGELEDWVEYQNYECSRYEHFAKNLDEARAQLRSRREALVAAGLPDFEGVYEFDNFGAYYGLAIEYKKEEVKAKDTERWAQKRLRLAERRLKMAKSVDIGERVERATWIRLFLNEVESAQLQLREAQRRAENARLDLEPVKAWWWANRYEWDRRESETEEEAQERVRLWMESTEFREQTRKKQELDELAIETSSQCFRAEREVEIAEKGLKVARSEHRGEVFETAAFIRMIQDEVQTAQAQFEEAKSAAEKVALRGKVLGALSSILAAKLKLERHQILVDWIERQRQEIVSGCGSAGTQDKQGRVERAGRGSVRNNLATKPSRPAPSSRSSGHVRKRMRERSILGPADPSRVTKAPRKKRSSRRKMGVSCEASLAKAATDLDTPQARGPQASKDEGVTLAPLRPIHSSRVSKPSSKRPAGSHVDRKRLQSATDGRRSARRKDSGMSSASSTGLRGKQQPAVPANASLRRSSRISKKPERFRPGYA